MQFLGKDAISYQSFNEREKQMDWISKGVLALVLIGGINWGLVGVFQFDLVAFLFGAMSILSRTIYILIGLAAVWILFSSFSPDKEIAK